MVGSTRGSPSGFGAGGNGNPPPPPPPAGIAEVLAAQTEILRQLVQAQQQPRGGHHAHQAQEASYQPPLFTKADEPLDADAWIRTIESKFSILTAPCSEANKTRYAAQQLRGSSRMWWDHYHRMLPADHVVNWDEFKNVFQAHHIPVGLLDRKLN